MTDIMSAMDLAVWPQAALVIFIGVFIAVLGRTLRRGRAQERWASLPLDDGGER